MSNLFSEKIVYKDKSYIIIAKKNKLILQEIIKLKKNYIFIGTNMSNRIWKKDNSIRTLLLFNFRIKKPKKGYQKVIWILVIFKTKNNIKKLFSAYSMNKYGIYFQLL